eukprot:TRINITY_DN65344_c0_g1_i1.p1 TRINITY_DN65344_c0_g1~~TRINITY_DN65344_c0_g1_i1.p1  ORF type:complete len:186 (+),score=35.08 TRINITY_DN65344_c0_g1_i1:110-667(+)
MGGCESCASSRRKDAAMALNESIKSQDASRLRYAIDEAEACGVDSMKARQQYCELLRTEDRTPDKVQEMIQWAIGTQDGPMLYHVLQVAEAQGYTGPDITEAKVRLCEFQEDMILRLSRLHRNRNAKGMVMALERARHMGIPASDLERLDAQLRALEASNAQPIDYQIRRSVGESSRTTTTPAAR